MKIFIDARVTNIGGPNTYTKSLVESILELDSKKNEYYVLYNQTQKPVSPEKSKVIRTTSKNPIYWIYWDKFFLPKIIAENHIDVYHSLKRPEIMNIRTKKIITLHAAHPFLHPELQSIGEKLYWRKRLEKASKCADAILAVSETDRKNLIQVLNLNPEKVHVHQLAISKDFQKLTRMQAVKSKAEDYAKKYILFIGTHFLYKNLPNMLKAFKLLKEDQSIEHKFLLVGKEGPASKEIYKIIEKLNIEEHVIIAGVVQDISSIYANADIFLFATLYDAFGFPVLEAMSMGVPVIVSTAGALPEVAGDAALKYDPNDIEGISNGMKSLLCDKDLRKEMIERGVHRVRNFSWERCAKETIKVYSSVYSM